METSVVKATPSALALQMPSAEFFKAFSPSNCLRKYVSASTPALALSSGAPSLAEIHRTYGHKFVIGFICLSLINLSSFLGKKFSLEKPQLEETAELLYAGYYYLNLADVTLVVNKIKSGEVPLYENLSPDKILKTFAAYSASRAEAARTANDARSEVIAKHGCYPESDPEKVLEKLSQKVLDYQEEAIKKEAEAEMARLCHDYRLHCAWEFVQEQRRRRKS